jgi:hypothetical protein
LRPKATPPWNVSSPGSMEIVRPLWTDHSCSESIYAYLCDDRAKAKFPPQSLGMRLAQLRYQFVDMSFPLPRCRPDYSGRQIILSEFLMRGKAFRCDCHRNELTSHWKKTSGIDSFTSCWQRS